MSGSQCHLVTTTSFHSIAIGNSSAAAFPSGVSPQRLQIVWEVTRGAVRSRNGRRAELHPPQRPCNQLCLGLVTAEVHPDTQWETGPWDAAGFPLVASQESDARVLSCCVPLSRGEREGVLLTFCLRSPWVLKQFQYEAKHLFVQPCVFRLLPPTRRVLNIAVELLSVLPWKVLW